MLEEQLTQDQDHEAGRVRTIQMSSIPDTLYMVEDRQYLQSYHPFSSSTSTVDIVAGTIPGRCKNRNYGTVTYLNQILITCEICLLTPSSY